MRSSLLDRADNACGALRHESSQLGPVSSTARPGSGWSRRRVRSRAERPSWSVFRRWITKLC